MGMEEDYPALFAPTTLDDWKRNDRYHSSFLIKDDPIIDAAAKNSKDSDIPDIAVSPPQGKFLNLLARSAGAKRILEVGTLAGLSTIWLARALPEGGSLTTLELDEKHAKVARENIANAGLADKVDLIMGDAAVSLKALSDTEPYDFIYIDAYPTNVQVYFAEAKRLVRPGGVIVVDNVVYNGLISKPAEEGAEWMDDIRALLKNLKEDKDVEATTISTVGVRGFDGLLYAVRN